MQNNNKKPEDLKREEQLYNYLSKSFVDYQKGQSGSMNKIIDEVCRKNKEVLQIQQWMDLFTRLLLQLSKTGNDAKLIIDIVLYKMPWFMSENHFQAIQSFKKCVFTILSLNSNQITSIYRLLVQKLQLSIEHSREDINCTIQGVQFTDKVALQQYIQELGNSYHLEKEDQILRLSENHKQFMKEIFMHHPNASQKLKGIIDMGFGYFPAKNRSKCFYIIKKNDHEDISYVKAVEGLYDDLYRETLFTIRDTKLSDFAIQMIVEIDQVYKLNRQKLLDLINETFPHKNMSEMHWKVSVINTLKLAEKIPELVPKLYRIVFTKLLSIDSEIKYDPQYNNFIIKTRLPIYNNKTHKDEMCRKLDHILFLLLDFIDSKTNSVKTSSKQIFIREENEEMLSATFKELQRVFQEIIIKNQNYRMVHYIYFYFCSLDEKYRKFQQHFITQLILTIKSTTNTRNEKINSIYYLSSLLVRCNKIEKPIFLKAIQIILEFLQNSTDIELDCHLIQMLAYLVSTKSSQLESLKDQIHASILHYHQSYNALSYLHYDILVKFNDVLLRSKSDEIIQKLIELTATIITKYMEKRNQGDIITTHHSPNTPLFYLDHESHLSRQSSWTQNNRQGNQLEFYQPFNAMTLIYSECFIRKSFKYDTELIKDEGGSLNNSHFIDTSPLKKLKRRITEPIAGEGPEKKVKQ